MTGASERNAKMRCLAVACLALCFAVPVVSHAGPTSGYTPIGPPASLNTIVFAGDGTAYGTVDSTTTLLPASSPASLWRGTDHGSTWSSVYTPQNGRRPVMLAASPTAVYASETGRDSSSTTERIDPASGRAVQLPSLGRTIGMSPAPDDFCGRRTTVRASSRSSCRVPITWFRGIRAVPGRHARTYLVGGVDKGHAIACQTRLADGTRLRSRAVRVPRRSKL